MASTHAHFRVHTAETRDTAISRTVNWMAATEPNRTRFEAIVLHATPSWFVLDSTWLEPDRVDALGDQGWIAVSGADLPIMRVEPDGAHHVHQPTALAAGDRVEVSVDHDLRRRRMRTSALQNLLRSVLGPSGEWQPARRTASRATLQQGWSGDIPCLDRIRNQLDCLIRERHQIWRVVDEADGGVYWQVDGVATIADESLSVTDTGAIGPFSLRLADSSGRVCIFAETLPT